MNSCPVSSEQILACAAEALRKKGFTFDDAGIKFDQAQEYCFPDVYLNIEDGPCDSTEPFICTVPFKDHDGNDRGWLVRVEIVNKDSKSQALITDRCMPYLDMMLKPSRGYQWHITDDCDQRCRHCYLFAEDARKNCVSTPWEQLVKTLEQIEEDAAFNYVFPLLAISGGDPILHPDFWQLAELIHSKGYVWMMMGNPFHLNEEVCGRLKDLGCIKYQMSLDGLKEYHDHMRKPGSYDATLDAVKLLNDAGIRSQLMATVSKENMDDVIKCMDIAVGREVQYFVFSRYCATSPEKASAYPSPEEYRQFLLEYYEKAQEYKKQGCKTVFQFKEHLFKLLQYELGDFVIPKFAQENRQYIFGGCHLAQTCGILANGDVCACRHMPSLLGNINTSSIHEMMTGELRKKYFDVTNIKKCKDCELLQFCRGCRAVGFCKTGDINAADPCCWK